jgi:HlyD family secretion protein
MVSSAIGSLLGRWKGRAAIAVLIAMIGGAAVYQGTAARVAPAYRTQPVTRDTVTSSVLVTGAIDPFALVKLSFKTSGRIADVLVTVGQRVTAGQAVARLDATDLQLAQAQATANVAAAQAKYDLTVAGAAPQDVAVAQQSVDNAKRSLDETQRTTANDLATAQQSLARLRSAYAAAQSGFQLYAAAVPTDVATFSAGVDSSRTINATAQQDLLIKWSVDIGSARSAVGQADSALVNAQTVAGNQLAGSLAEWTSARDKVISAWQQFDSAVLRGTDPSGAVTAYQSAQLSYATATSHLGTALSSVSASITAAQTAVSAAQAGLNTTNTAQDSDLAKARADLAGEQGALASEVQIATTLTAKLAQMTTDLATISDAVGGSYVATQQAVTNAQERGTSAVQSAQSLYDAAVTSLSRTAAPARSFDIAAAYAGVLVQRAALDKATSDLTNATLVAPVAGSISQVAAHAGEQVTGSAPVIVLSDASSVTFHGTVGEADIAKLRLDQAASVAIDALARPTPLAGKITSIDPVGAVQQGIPSYGLDITVSAPDAGLQTGMTGTASIALASKQNVLVVPNAALHSADGRTFVEVVKDGQEARTDVRIGLTGATTSEVTDGLTEGQIVALPQSVGGLSAEAPLAYPAPTEPTLERIAIVVSITNETADDLVVTPTDLLARDAERHVYTSDPQAGVTDARVIRATAAFAGMKGVQPLPTVTLRQNDVLVGYVVYDVPTGVRPTQLIWRQTDSDRVVDLPSR